MVTFLIVRHGYSETNKRGIFAGSTNAELDEKGVAQGKLVCEYISKNYKVDAIYSSDLSRAYDTVKPLSDIVGVPVIKRKALQEMDCGVWENMDVETLLKEHGEQFRRWKESDDLATPDGGESWTATADRVYNEFLSIAKKNENKTVVVATHGVAIRSLRGKYLNIPMNEWKDKIPYAPNASITVVQFEDGKFTEKGVIDSYLGGIKTEMPKGI